ncbi:MAG TPA: M67 family metallopeptidase [Bryobacteraceae bacterium]|jgi:proteasome lid subunit RPN8/RPN11|nr:M67 family metallopeptidase [Bryobacteraceae bacterium]
MIRIEREAWERMVAHAEQCFPKEGCGVMVGTAGAVSRAVALPNVYDGPQEDFFVMDPKDLNRVDEEARRDGLEVLGIYHSHPDCDAYFSKRDLEHSCPWFSYVVLSIKSGRLDHANSYRPDFDQTVANKEELVYG